MSTEIKLLESIRDKLDTGFQLLAGQIGETTIQLGRVGAAVVARLNGIDEHLVSLDSRVGHLETGVGHLDSRVDHLETGIGNLEKGLANLATRMETGFDNLATRIEKQFDFTNSRLDTIVSMQSDISITLSTRADETDKRLGSLEHRVDKLEEAS